MCEDLCIYIFGYGSLIWRPGFPYLRKFDGFIRGWKRVFWQSSTDHRGTPEAPGRVVTLVKDDQSITWGTVYCVPDEEAYNILKNLDYREKGGYTREEVDVFIPGKESPVVSKSILYVGTSKNSCFTGETPTMDIAQIIYKSVGPSGPNVDYLLNLAESLRKMNAVDDHISEIENHVLSLVRASPQQHHTHPKLLTIIQQNTITVATEATTATITTTTTTTTTTSTDSPNTSPRSNTSDDCSAQSEKNNMQRKYFFSKKADVKGYIYIDNGAVMALSQRGRSLLAAGIVKVEGDFDHHTLISVLDSCTKTEIARGVTTYGCAELESIKGLHSTKIGPTLGYTRGDVVVNNQNMILV